MKIKALIAFAILSASLFGQTTTYTGTIRDLSGAVVTSGNVTFTLTPSVDTTISGTSRFTPNTVNCTINGSGALVANDGVSACVVTQNTALTPTGTSYTICIQPQFTSPGSCFVDYAVTSSKDISTVAPTPQLSPNYPIYSSIFASQQTITAPWTFISTNSVLNATQYASGSNTCGIAEAYAAGASTGVAMVMSGDCTISSAQTITTVVQKPLYLNGQGHTITCTHTSGICITLIKPDSTPRTSVVISNLHIVYSGTSASVTGVKIGSQAASATDVVLRDVDISKFSTSGAAALELDNAEDCAAYSVKLNGNTLALKLDKFTNNNQFFGLNIQGGVQAISMTDASGNNFIGGLVQSNTGVRTITQTSSTVAINGNTFQNVWFESNGDTTASSRVFYNFATGTAHNIAGFSLVGNTINAGTNGASGKVYEFTGDSTSATVSPILKGNTYGGYGANIITGTLVFPTSVEGEAATFGDVGMNINGAPGLHFWPQTGAHHYQMFAGDSAQSGNTNNWLMKDLTASTTPLLYTASTQAWLLPGAIQLGAADVGLSRGAAGQVNVGNGTAGDASGTLNAAVYNVGGVSPTGSGAVVLASGAAITPSSITVGSTGSTTTQFEMKNGVAGCATAASAGATCTTVVTWPNAFADSGYIVGCIGSGLTSGVPLNGGLTARSTTTVTFQTVSGTAAAAQYTTIECHAWHP